MSQGRHKVFLTLITPGTRYVEYLERTTPDGPGTAEWRAPFDASQQAVIPYIWWNWNRSNYPNAIVHELAYEPTS
jgi:hypothetical protein